MYQNLKNEINQYIKTNGTRSITGALLNGVLNDMVDALGAVGGYGGIITPTSAAPQSDGNVFFVSNTAGTYTNFSNIVVNENELAFIYRSGSGWAKDGITLSAGGTQVEANPAGEATETMQTIKIGETIYTAPEGPVGPNGTTPHIGDNGDWYIGDQDTGVQAEGQDGTNGTNGITPTINPSNKHWMIGETDTGIIAEGQDGQNGAPGQNAVNPFKGWWPDLATLKAAHTATEGDSAYVKDASPATTWSIYVYDSTASSDNYWVDSGLDADTSHAQTFASGEEVNETYIDDTHLANPANGALPKAEDLLLMKAKLQEINLEETKDNTVMIDGYYPDENAHLQQSANGGYKKIDVSGCSYIRVLGLLMATTTTHYGEGFCFFNENAVLSPEHPSDTTGLISIYPFEWNTSTSYGKKDYVIPVPAGAKWLYVQTKTSTVAGYTDGFYCYKQKGQYASSSGADKLKPTQLSFSETSGANTYQAVIPVTPTRTYRIRICMGNWDITGITGNILTIKEIDAEGNDIQINSHVNYEISSFSQLRRYSHFDLCANYNAAKIVVTVKTTDASKISCNIEEITPTVLVNDTLPSGSGLQEKRVFLSGLLPDVNYRVNMGGTWPANNIQTTAYSFIVFYKNTLDSTLRPVFVQGQSPQAWSYTFSIPHEGIKDAGLFLRGNGNEHVLLSITEANDSEYTRLNNIMNVNEGAIPNTLSLLKQNELNVSDKVINIGMFGDSWTHGKNIGVNSYVSYCYVNDLALKLYEKFGYAGLGWCDLNYTGGRFMGCAVNQAINITRAGTYSVVDKKANSLGITIAHTVLSENEWYRLQIADTTKYPCDKAKIWYYGGAKFKYQVDGGTEVTVNDSHSGGWYSETITAASIGTIKMTATANNTIIFGVDFSYGNKGVKVHKIGNSALDSQQVVNVDRNNLVEGLGCLELDFCSIMLGLNDLATTSETSTATYRVIPSVFKDNMREIMDIMLDANQYCDVVLLGQGPSGHLYDTERPFPLTAYLQTEYELAGEFRCPFVSVLNELKANIAAAVDSNRDHYNTYYDNHPNSVGSAIIADVIYKHLFT